MALNAIRVFILICLSTSAFAKVSEKSGRPQAYGVGYLTWQEPVDLMRKSDSRSFPLQSVQSGWGFQYSRELLARGNWQIEAQASLFLTSSSVMTSSKDEVALSGLNYRTTDALVYGGWLAPEITWGRDPRESRFGITFPLLFRRANWPDVSSGGNQYLIQSKSKSLLGVWLTTRFQREAWGVSTRLGYLAGSSSFAWMVGLTKVWSE